MLSHLLLLSLTLSIQCLIVPQLSSPGRLTGSSFGLPSTNATYDYVIVGAGLAGSVVASRLTEHSNATVALVEAGNFYELSNGNWSQIPYFSTEWVGAGEDQYQPLIDWGLFTAPQVNGKNIHYAQGRNLGGSSGRNQMIYHRPTVGTYQWWAEIVGDESWNWENMTEFYERSMTFTPNEEVRADNATANYTLSAFSDQGGPLHVSFPAYAQPISSYAPAAFASIGMNASEAFSSGVLNGYGYTQFTIDPETGLRSSAESSFLAQALGRENLKVYVNAMARKILFENGTAVGVNITSYGARPFTLSARKEVIISSGAYHSPQLLMVSGIGPRETLERYNISVVSALEGVGQNMWDSCNIGGPIYQVNVPGATFWQQGENMVEAADLLRTNGTGPLTNMGSDFLAWEKLPAEYRANMSTAALQALSVFPDDWPEVEYTIGSSASTLTSSDTTLQYGSVGILLVAATSRGNMTIKSANNMDNPVISPNWLMDQTDQEVAVQAYKRARTVWKAIDAKIGEEIYPGTNVTTDPELLEVIKKNIAPIHHATSSCAMGRVGEPNTVVDSKARVQGVKSLRVIDSSSFPFTNPGHTQGSTYAHAEKLVQAILDDMV